MSQTLINQLAAEIAVRQRALLFLQSLPQGCPQPFASSGDFESIWWHGPMLGKDGICVVISQFGPDWTRKGIDAVKAHESGLELRILGAVPPREPEPFVLPSAA